MRAGRHEAARAFGQTLKTARLARGIRQEELAEYGDFDPMYASLLERGRRTPTFFVILELAKALDTDPVVLFADAVARLSKRVSPLAALRGRAVSALDDRTQSHSKLWPQPASYLQDIIIGRTLIALKSSKTPRRWVDVIASRSRYPSPS